MFTGIIESLGVIKEVKSNGSNLTFWIESPLSHEFKVDQSVSHNGVCLTVEEIRGNQHRVTAIKETLEKTNLSNWKPGSRANLERSMTINSRLDGHLVQGHADGEAICIEKKNENGSWLYRFEFSSKFAPLIIEKGSICIDGISLTAFNVTENQFSVAIIPFTFEHTNIQFTEKGSTVNIEFDVLGKYVLRKLSVN